MFRFTKISILCVIVSVLIFTVGCSQQQKQTAATDNTENEAVAKDVVEEPAPETTDLQAAVSEPEIDAPQDAPEQTEPVVKQAEPSQENTEAVSKLEFAVRYMDSARKGILSYSQAVVLCRDIIKQYPGTPYEKQARELLNRVPEDQRSRYHITNEELGL